MKGPPNDFSQIFSVEVPATKGKCQCREVEYLVILYLSLGMNPLSLDGSEKALGKEHPYTLTSVNNLALVPQHQGKYEVAEERY
jgi:hypothetical protein